VAAKPTVEEFAGQIPATDESRTHVPTKYRSPGDSRRPGCGRSAARGTV
jgi:hypothetical protein